MLLSSLIVYALSAIRSKPIDNGKKGRGSHEILSNNTNVYYNPEKVTEGKMLVTKIYINHRQIDEIHIQNVLELRNGHTKYMIRKPEMTDDLAELWHIRESGYEPLLAMALERIEGEK